MRSLTAIGTPCSGPSMPPWFDTCSHIAAEQSAPARSTVMKLLSSDARMRSSELRTTSIGDARLHRNASTSVDRGSRFSFVVELISVPLRSLLKFGVLRSWRKFRGLVGGPAQMCATAKIEVVQPRSATTSPVSGQLSRLTNLRSQNAIQRRHAVGTNAPCSPGRRIRTVDKAPAYATNARTPMLRQTRLDRPPTRRVQTE